MNLHFCLPHEHSLNSLSILSINLVPTWAEEGEEGREKKVEEEMRMTHPGAQPTPLANVNVQ